MSADPLAPMVLEFVHRISPEASAGTSSAVRLAGDGSGRRYFRVTQGGRTRVVIVNPLAPGRSHPDENEGFVAVRDFLASRGVRVPRIDETDLGRGLLMTEDLGDERLCDRVASEGWGKWPQGALPGLYRRAVRALVRMHAPTAPAFDPDRAPNPPYAEPFVLEWEAGYFHGELVCGWARLDRTFAAIEPECRAIARDALELRPTLERLRAFMHRDFQSRNVMVAGSEVAILDFQGARVGPPEYDLAAFLYDPYVSMPENIRRELIALYVAEAAAAGVPGVSSREDDAWRRRFLANAANRLMQALGAYGKLGGRFGLPGFLEFVPPALRSLENVLVERGGSPTLLALVAELRGMAGER